jgi:hypothetical protein
MKSKENARIFNQLITKVCFGIYASSHVLIVKIKRKQINAIYKNELLENGS